MLKTERALFRPTWNETSACAAFFICWRVPLFNVHSCCDAIRLNLSELEKLYFQVTDVEMMSQSYRTRVLEELNWSSAQDKVRGLLHKFKSMERALDVSKTLKTYYLSRFVGDETEFYWQVCIMIITYTSTFTPQKQKNKKKREKLSRCCGVEDKSIFYIYISICSILLTLRYNPVADPSFGCSCFFWLAFSLILVNSPEDTASTFLPEWYVHHSLHVPVSSVGRPGAVFTKIGVPVFLLFSLMYATICRPSVTPPSTTGRHAKHCRYIREG